MGALYFCIHLALFPSVLFRASQFHPVISFICSLQSWIKIMSWTFSTRIIKTVFMIMITLQDYATEGTNSPQRVHLDKLMTNEGLEHLYSSTECLCQAEVDSKLIRGFFIKEKKLFSLLRSVDIFRVAIHLVEYAIYGLRGFGIIYFYSFQLLQCFPHPK